MNYPETLDYLFSRLPMFTRIGAAAFKKDLTNTIALCEVLGHPETQFRSIHIAGTNGKGSTSHMLASILQEAGYTTGLYTSPHLRDFRERIRVNGEMIPEETVVRFVADHMEVFDTIRPSFFEWTVALCFDYFAATNVDIAIIETGLGGRLDSTNVITPLLSVITNIGWDHTDMLGNTLPEIAGEKAGIIKPGIPVVIGEQHPETFPVFTRKASETNSRLIAATDAVEITSFTHTNTTSNSNISSNGSSWLDKLECDLPGTYQQHNITTVLAAVLQLREQGFTITDEQIRNGMKHVKSNTGLAGRWQQLSASPLIICDTGHNENGIKYVVQQISETPHARLHMVIGMVRDKDIAKVLALLPKNAVYYFCNAAIPRALPAEELAEQARAAGLQGQPYGSVSNALDAARNNAGADDLIFIGGSTFVVAEVV